MVRMARNRRLQYADDAEYQRARNAKYRAETRDARRIYEQERWRQTKADPIRLERARAQARRSTAAYRARQKLEQAA
jgi:hypothetical protein